MCTCVFVNSVLYASLKLSGFTVRMDVRENTHPITCILIDTRFVYVLYLVCAALSRGCTGATAVRSPHSTGGHSLRFFIYDIIAEQK